MPLDPDDERRMRRAEDALVAFLDAFDALLPVIIPLVERAGLNDDDEVVGALAELQRSWGRVRQKLTTPFSR